MLILSCFRLLDFHSHQQPIYLSVAPEPVAEAGADGNNDSNPKNLYGMSVGLNAEGEASLGGPTKLSFIHAAHPTKKVDCVDSGMPIIWVGNTYTGRSWRYC